MSRKIRGKRIKENRSEEIKDIQPSQKIKKDSWFLTLTDQLLNTMTKGDLDEQTSNFQISFNKVLSENQVKQVIQILRVPTLVPVGYLEDIREHLLNTIPIGHVPDVDIQIHEYYNRNYMAVSDKKMTKLKGSVNNAYHKQATLVKQITEHISKLNDGRITENDLNHARNNLKLRERKKKSFDTVIDHKREGGEYLTAYIFLEITCRNKELLKQVMDKVSNILQSGYKKEPYEFQILNNNLMEYLKEYGIASYHKQGRKGMKLPYMDFPSTVLSIDEKFTTGIVRSTQPRLCLGNLIQNNYPLHVDFTETDDSYNILFLGDTGSGKTKAMMYMLLGVMLDPRSNVMVDDLKGLEWSNFAKMFDRHAIVSFNLMNPMFVNTLAIPDWKRFRFANPRASYMLAYNTTLRMLGSLFKVDSTQQMIIGNILADLLDHVYLYSGIDVMQPGTYHKSKDLPFADTLITRWNSITKEKSFVGKHDKLMVDLVNEVLHKYFSRRGPKRFIFEEEIDVEDLMNKKFIVFDHGKDIVGGSAAKTEEEIMCGMVQKSYISNLYTALNFMRGEYTYEFMEEIVRQLSNSFTTAYLVDELVGKRSSNKRNILAFNSLDVLLNPKENADDIGKIREQIGLYIVGRVKESTAYQLIDHIGRPEIEETLLNVAMQSHQDVKYERSFAFINYHCGSVRGIHAYKCVIPRTILDTYMSTTHPQ